MAKSTQSPAPEARKPASQEHVDRQQARAAAAGPMPQVQITDPMVANWFTYHAPDAEQVEQMKLIRQAGGALAQIIRDNTPNSADQTAAIRKVREAVMTANASIVCRGR